MTRKLSVLLLSLLALVSCKSQYDALLASNDVDAKYKAAFDYFNQGKYQKSAAMFESLSMLTSGTEKDDTVQYYRGLSNYRYKDFETAEGNFASFVETYPHSTFTPEALFLRLDCLYRATYRYELDQAPTRTAMQAIPTPASCLRATPRTTIGATVTAPAAVSAMSVASFFGSVLVKACGRNFLTIPYEVPT